jgi:hypothetical protein
MRSITFARATFALAALSTSAFAQSANEDWKLIPSDTQQDALFGFSVSVDNDRALIGAVAHDEFTQDQGSAYIWERQPDGSWLEIAKLTPTLPDLADLFGGAVSLEGDRAVVTQWLDDDAAPNAGAVFVFERQTNGFWLEVAKITASDAQNNDQFGRSVKLTGNRMIVGAWGDDDNGNAAGAAYVFERQTNGTWLELAKLKPQDGAALDEFGIAVDIEGDRAVVGSHLDDDGAAGAGSAYVFERQASGMWRQMSKLVASDPGAGDDFGYSVALEGTRILVGNRGQDNGTVFQTGEVYEYQRVSAFNWAQIQRFQTSAPSVSAEFGNAIDLRGNRAVIGAWAEAGTIGAAYVFDRQTSGTWQEIVRLAPSDGAADDFYGIGVAWEGSSAMVSAYAQDPAFTDAGAAYAFDLGTLYHGARTISVATGGTQNLLLRAGPTKANQAFVILGTGSGTAPGIVDPGSGVLLPLNFDAYFNLLLSTAGGGIIAPWVGLLDANGNANATITLPPLAPGFAGRTLHHAYLMVDIFGTGLASAASNPVAVTTVP